MRHALALTMLLVLGCAASKPGPTAGPAKPPAEPLDAAARARCAAAIAEAAKTGRQGEQFSPEDAKFNAEIEATMSDGCAATKWPEFMLQCLTNGTSRDELKMCNDILTDVQRQDFMERVLAVTKKHEELAKPAPAPSP